MPKKPVGWRKDSARHGLAAKGVKTATVRGITYREDSGVMMEPLLKAEMEDSAISLQTAWENFKNRPNMSEFIPVIRDEPIWGKRPKYDWPNAPIKNIPLDSILTTQTRLNPENVKNAIYNLDKIPPAIVIEQEGKYYVQDGHHRLIAAKLLGRKTFPARVMERGPRSGRGEGD